MAFDFKTILFALLGIILVFGFIKKLFKLVLVIASIAVAFYFFAS